MARSVVPLPPTSRPSCAETPWPQGAGVLPSFQLSLPCDRAESATKRTLSRPTLTVEAHDRGECQKRPLPSVDTPRCDLRPSPGTAALQPTKRREVLLPWGSSPYGLMETC